MLLLPLLTPLQLLVQALLMGGVRYPLPEGAAPVLNLHKASALIALGRYQQASGSPASAALLARGLTAVAGGSSS